MVEDKGPDEARTDCTLELLDYDGSAIATYNDHAGVAVASTRARR